MEELVDVLIKYPEYADRILRAYNVVLDNPDRDLELELNGCKIATEDMLLLGKSLVETWYSPRRRENGYV